MCSPEIGVTGLVYRLQFTVYGLLFTVYCLQTLTPNL